jgi:O-antigen ligase
MKEFSVFYSNDGSLWLFDQAQEFTKRFRAQGTMPHANPFGGFLFLSILATYRLTLKKWLFGLTLPLQFFALCLSFSRSAILATLVASLVWFSLLRGKRLVILLALFSVALSGTLLYKQLLNRGGGGASIASNDERIELSSIALQIIKDHPFTGIGYFQFTINSQDYFPKEAPHELKKSAPHNIFFFLACETGLISAAVLLIAILLLLYRFIKLPKTADRVTMGALLIGFLLIGSCDYYPIFSQQGMLMFFLVLGLLSACLRMETSVIQGRCQKDSSLAQASSSSLHF